ncbi:nucleotidyltransferase domain-containing protein [Peribacillus deserti]|uniref:Nucleotidyltransferase domain-containing protein n=1 Tax=Peribacillus deserti TaxID=673318 RepID=A0A2N5M4S1_9BACI|nr:nucleotidyltransferase domain-containing protein [Peribacillus deserti]PLT29371.1 nucleotidyltransferase domain-containing protein [Peribacillus deserti]
MRSDPILAAASFVNSHFPRCEAALLAGSVVRGETTSTSDLDLFIYMPSLHKEYRESFYEEGWMVEAFVHTSSSYKKYFSSDCDRGRPSLPKMVAEGVIIKNSPSIPKIKEEAQTLLAQGPKLWDSQTIEIKRYMLTDVLLDFIGAKSREEEIFIAGSLSELLHEFILRINGQWSGSSKWIYKALRNFDRELASRFFAAFEEYYRTGKKSGIISLTDKSLEPYGGRLFAGFSLGKNG